MTDDLSVTEVQVTALIAAGLSKREIGQRLDTNEQRVAEHVSHLVRKLGLRKRVQVAVWESSRGSIISRASWRRRVVATLYGR